MLQEGFEQAAVTTKIAVSVDYWGSNGHL